MFMYILNISCNNEETIVIIRSDRLLQKVGTIVRRNKPDLKENHDGVTYKQDK